MAKNNKRSQDMVSHSELIKSAQTSAEASLRYYLDYDYFENKPNDFYRFLKYKKWVKRFEEASIEDKVRMIVKWIGFDISSEFLDFEESAVAHVYFS